MPSAGASLPRKEVILFDFLIVFVLILLLLLFVPFIMALSMRGTIKRLELRVKQLEANAYRTASTLEQPANVTSLKPGEVTTSSNGASETLAEVSTEPSIAQSEHPPVTRPARTDDINENTSVSADEDSGENTTQDIGEGISEDEALLANLRERYAALVAVGAAPALRSDENVIDAMDHALRSIEQNDDSDVADRVATTATEPLETEIKTETQASKSSFVFNFEDLFGRKLSIWAGGITLAIAGILIVKQAIDAGLLTPWARITAGLLFGSSLIVGAEYAYRKESIVRDPRVRQALSGAGIATLYATILMAHNGYGLIGPIVAFIAMAIVTAGALGLSLRFGAPSALLGLAGGLATPALVGSTQPNIPLLAAYLALTVGGLTAVSRRQRWAWLGIAALAGGGVWSLILILTDALTPSSSVAIGFLIIALAIGLPFYGLSSVRTGLSRAIAAIIGAAQIALLVAMGGFTPLHWSLFILIATACQWLVWRERHAKARDPMLTLLPVTSLSLSILLLLIWPDPSHLALTIVSVILLLLHAVPLFPRIWGKDANYPAVQWAAMGIAFLMVGVVHFWEIFSTAHNLVISAITLVGALFTFAPIATGWSHVRTLSENEPRDTRFAILATAGGVLLAASGYFAIRESWSGIVVALVGLGLLTLVNRAGHPRRALSIPAIFILFGAALVTATVESFDEISRLFGFDYKFDISAMIRWGLTASILTVFSLYDSTKWGRRMTAAVAALLFYGALAQIVPPDYLPVAVSLCLSGLSFIVGKHASSTTEATLTALTVFAMISILWAANSVMGWLAIAGATLSGLPIDITLLPTAIQSVTYLALPALFGGIALWKIRPFLSTSKFSTYGVTLTSAALIAIFSIAVHILYRHAFAAVAGFDFIATGMAQRALWAVLLLGLGWALTRYGARLLPDKAPLWCAPAVGTIYLFYFSYLIHDPLWSEQAVGNIPVVNMLTVTFAVIMGGLWLTEREAAKWPSASTAIVTRIVDGVRALVVILFAYQTLAQAFHGTMLYPTAIGDAENILRSILAIALAVGFLLWSIRTHKRDWRIASLILMLLAVTKVFLLDASGLTGLTRIGSFVALGFSLIGIGWLYSRQLRSEPLPENGNSNAPAQ